MQSMGSVWRKWDLHIHTPASYVWHGQKANMRDTTQATEVCRLIAERMEAIDVDAFAIMDYWTFDGFYALRDYLNRNQSATKKRVFPGIEIRLEAPTNYKLNTHVIFDESLSNDNLSLFLAHLSIGGLEDKPPSRENFIGLGRSYDDGKLRVHGYAPADRADDDKMFILGMKSAVATRKSLEAAIKIAGEENCLLVQPYDTSDGLEDLDWKRHPFTDSQLMKWADIFETRDPLHVRLFLGQGHPTKTNVGEEFVHNLGGYAKPAVSGSDAHKISDYGVYRKAISQLQSKLRSLNEEIVKTEFETSKETIDSFRTALSLKQAELDAHDKTRPKEVPSPADESQSPEAKKISEDLAEAQARLDDALRQMGAATNERTLLATRQALLIRIAGHLKNFEDSYTAFVEETARDFEAAGLNARTIVSLTVNRAPILLDSERVTSRLAELSVLINGGKDTIGLEIQCNESRGTIESLRGRLDAPQERHQQYLTDLRRWETRRNEILGSPTQPESIEYLKARIENAESFLPPRLIELREQRIELARGIHTEITNIRGVFEELYKPVQNMAASTEFTQESIQLHFDAFLSASSFEVNFLDFIHKNRRGNFYGEAESSKAVEDLLTKHEFNTSDGVVRFLDDVMSLLTTIAKGEEKEPITIQSQLKSGKKATAVYDFLFGLEYVEPRYTLKLGSKPIAQLSPGEKGALLLVFYLLLDREEIPIIIDQPEQNLDNESVVKLLVGCIRKATDRRQVIIVTHNPNLAVVCDADQLICMSIDKADGNRIKFSSGAIEDNPINRTTVDVLEGTYPAFDNRRKKYHKP